MVKTWKADRPKATVLRHRAYTVNGATAYDGKWQKLTHGWLLQYPLCVLCLARGRVNQGANEQRSDRQRNLVVDHIVPHRGDSALFWDQDNWQTLCRMPCHDRDKRRSEGASRDWFAWLRQIMEQDGTRETVVAYRDLLPERIAIELLRSEAG